MLTEAQRLDAQRMLPYLTRADTGPIRKTNLTQVGAVARLPEFSQGTSCMLGAPCNACVEAVTSRSLCAKNGGIWDGSGSSVPGAPAEGPPDCCAVNAFRKANGEGLFNIDRVLSHRREKPYTQAGYRV